MEIKTNKCQLKIGTKELFWIVILAIVFIIAIRPDSFALMIDKIIDLANTPGLLDFVSAITTTAIQNH